MSPSPPSHIIIVADSLPAPGGAEKVALDTAGGLVDAGFHVTLFAGTLVREIPNLDSRIGVIDANGKHVRELAGMGEKLRIGLWNPSTAAAMNHLLSECDPGSTVVHFHSYMNVCTPSVFEPIRNRTFAAIVTGHDYGLACPTLGFYDSKRNDICSRRALSPSCTLCDCTGTSRVNKLGFVARARKLRLKAKVPSLIRHLIAVSKGSGDILKPYLPQTEIHVVRNPIDIEQPDSPVDVVKNRAFGFMARLTPEKDPVFFAEAAKTAGVDGMVLGDGPELDSAKAANPSLAFHGHVGRAEVNETMKRFRALVITSRWYEAAPLVIQESLARGIPVILPSRCAGRDAITHGVNGLIYEHLNHSSLIECMTQLLDDEVVRAMGERAYEGFWVNPPTMASYIGELAEVYQLALRDR